MGTAVTPKPRAWARHRYQPGQVTPATPEQITVLRQRLARLRLSIHGLARQQGFSYQHLNALLRGSTRTSIYLEGANWYAQLVTFLDTYEQALEVVRLQAKTAEMVLQRSGLPIPETLLPCLLPYDEQPLPAPHAGRRHLPRAHAKQMDRTPENAGVLQTRSPRLAVASA